MNVNFTLNIENGLYLEDFLKKSAIQKIYRKGVCETKQKCATATFIYTHEFLLNSDEEILRYGQKIRKEISRIFFAFHRFLFDRLTWKLKYCYNIVQHTS